MMIALDKRSVGKEARAMSEALDRRAALEQLMAAHGGSLLRMCTLQLRDRHLAEDAVQETFLKAYRKLDSFRGEASELSWLTSIAIHVCRDMQRGAWLKHIDRRVDVTALPETGQEDRYPDRTVIREVMALPPKYREVVVLRYYQGMTLQETADALRLSLTATKARLFRANATLRDRLKEWYDEAE